MSKWADYLISAVRYDTKSNHISFVEWRIGFDGLIGVAEHRYRQAVISAIENGNTVCTIYKEKDTWHKGEMVNVFEVGEEKFLRTDGNQTTKDNLGNLPTF